MRASVRCNVSGLGAIFAAALLVLLIAGESGAAPPFDGPTDARIVSPLNGGQVAVIDTAARAPFQRSFPQFVIPLNRNVGQSCVAIPFFKRLTIEHVSGSAFFLPPNSAIVWFQLETKADGFTTGHILVPVATAWGTTLAQFVTSQQVRLYADGGTDVCFRVFGTDQSGAITVDAQVSGYLVDLTSP
jgi:hypothetical protein